MAQRLDRASGADVEAREVAWDGARLTASVASVAQPELTEVVAPPALHRAGNGLDADPAIGEQEVVGLMGTALGTAIAIEQVAVVALLFCLSSAIPARALPARRQVSATIAHRGWLTRFVFLQDAQCTARHASWWHPVVRRPDHPMR